MQHLESVGIAHLANVSAGDLSCGHRRALEIATTLALDPEVTVLARGRILAQGDYASVACNEDVIEAYLGVATSEATQHSTTRTVLDISDLKAWHGPSQALYDIALTVRTGDLVTLFGRNGAGKTTTLRSIVGQVAETFDNATLLADFERISARLSA
ncbi:ATP-binding cassette domain-containing protein [uncultured Roseovarius sp.]|uniref:ATP-binding cassette domain-containing protein n=1 Tax=uncultured Roseovarius sp. TaxID=293344 RepID=UPI002629BE93|nr:ATP-binding cassette domain-containing protein [uncultured Roseovarius sp.]